jgi:alpha-methylacyl-CoA racemase
VSIDLQRTEGRAAFMGLVAQADILLEGFRPRVAERLNNGPDDCLRRQPSCQVYRHSATIFLQIAYSLE